MGVAGERWTRFALLSICAACANPASPGIDAAVPDAPPSQAELDAARAQCTGEPPVMFVRDRQTDQTLPADWSCLAWKDGADLTAPARRLPFQLSFPMVAAMPSAEIESQLNMFVSGVTADFFFGPSTLGKPDITHVFDTYTTELDIPEGATRMSVAIHARMREPAGISIIAAREYDIPIAADSTRLQAHFTLRDSRRLTVNLASGGGDSDDPSRASIAALIRDCSGRDVIGAQFELVDADTGDAVEDLLASYLQSALPTTHCTYTTGDWPAWVAFNAPVNIVDGAKQHAYKLSVRGRMRSTESEAKVFAERDVELFAGENTFLNGSRSVR